MHRIAVFIRNQVLNGKMRVLRQDPACRPGFHLRRDAAAKTRRSPARSGHKHAERELAHGVMIHNHALCLLRDVTRSVPDAPACKPVANAFCLTTGLPNRYRHRVTRRTVHQDAQL